MSYTYVSLQTEIKNYTEVDETTFNNTIDTFIRNAEERMLKTVQMSVFRKQTSISITPATSARVVAPEDFLASLSFSINQTVGTGDSAVEYKTFLEEKSFPFVIEQQISTSASGVPKYYAMVGSSETGASGTIEDDFPLTTFQVAPKADTPYNGTLIYLYRPVSLVDTASDATYGSGSTVGTTWLSTNAPRALLFGSLVEAHIFLKSDPQVITMHEEQFKDAMVGLKQLGEARETQDEYRAGLIIRQRQ